VAVYGHAYSSEWSRREHNRRQQEKFDQVASFFERPIPADIWGRMEAIVAGAAIQEGESVLDVGTGTGALIPIILAYSPGQLIACDLSGEMLKRARLRFGDRVTFYQRDVLELADELGPVDVMIFNACFSNMHDQVEAARVAANLLRPGGRLVISHPMGSAFVRHLHQEDPLMVPHLLPDEQEARSLLQAAGLELVNFTDEPLLYSLVGRKPPKP